MIVILKINGKKYSIEYNKCIEYAKSINITPSLIYAVLYRVAKSNTIDMFKEYEKIGRSFFKYFI